MIRFSTAGLACLLFMQTSCNSQQNNNKKTVLDTYDYSGKNKKAAAAAHKEQSPYELHGIIDPGINNMVAFAMQTPRGWHMQQSFTRKWNRSTPITQVYIKIVSPGGDNIVEYLPSSAYFYTDGPMARNMRQMAASYAQSMPRTPGEMAPMPALEYIRRVLLPQLAQRGLRMQPSGQKILPGNQAKNVTTSIAYVDGVLSNGMKVRVDCIVTLTTTQLNSETYYNWETLPSVTQSKANLDAAYASVTHGRKSIILNPSWLRQNQQLVTNGNIANSNIDRQNAAIQKDYRDYTNKIINQTYEERNKSIDRNSEAFSDMMRGDAKYENTETGERVKLSDAYNHVYQDRQGNNYGTNSPVDAGQFDWKELQRVETKNY